MDENRLKSNLVSNSNRLHSIYSPMSTNLRPTSQIVISNPTITNKKHHFPARKSVLKVTLCKDVEEKDKPDTKYEQVRLRKPRKENLAKFRETIVINDQPQCDKKTNDFKAPVGDQSDVKVNGIGDAEETVIVLGETEQFSLQNLKQKIQNTKIKDDQEQVECPECNKKLKINSFNAHVKTHLGVKPYACTLCGARFTRRGDVTRHKRLIHETPRKFMCSTCEKYFLSAEDLDSHMECHNTVCPTCAKSFTKAEDLATHMQQEHERKPTLKLKCNVCHYSFGKQIYYESHIKYVHPEGNAKLSGYSQGQHEEQKCSKEDLDDASFQTKQLNKGKIPMILKNKTKNLPRSKNYIIEQSMDNTKEISNENINMVVEKSVPVEDVELVSEEVHETDSSQETQHLQIQSIQPQTIETKHYIYKDKSDDVQYIYKDKSDEVQYVYKDQTNDVQYIYKDESNGVQYIYKDDLDQVQYLYKDDQDNYETEDNEQVYMIVDEELDNSQDVNEPNEESGDAVQTLIDAVQQLIQTHEANNPKEGEKRAEEVNKKPILIQKNNVVERVKILQSNGGQQIVQIGQHVDLNQFC